MKSFREWAAEEGRVDELFGIPQGIAKKVAAGALAGAVMTSSLHGATPATPPASSATVPASLTAADYAAFTKNWEGFKKFAYTDTKGYWTIGYGTCIDPKIKNRTELQETLSKLGYNLNDLLARRDHMDPEDAEKLLMDDIGEAIDAAPDLVKNFKDQPAEVKKIIVDMIYNLGEAKFAEFKHTIAALERKDYKGAAAGLQNSLWFKQVGRRGVNHVRTLLSLAK